MGRFPMQYYNRFGAGKNRRCGLERTGADIGTEAVFPVVYCGRKEFFIIRKLEFIVLWQLLQFYPQ